MARSNVKLRSRCSVTLAPRLPALTLAWSLRRNRCLRLTREAYGACTRCRASLNGCASLHSLTPPTATGWSQQHLQATSPDSAWRPQARRLGLLEDAAVQRALESMTAETNALEALSDQERNGTRVRAWWAVRAGARRLQTRA